MKRILLASTALVAAAGMASAQVSSGVALSGNAEIGIKGLTGDFENDNTVFHHDLDLNITFFGSTDTGLEFGADIDLDEISEGISDSCADDTGNCKHIVYVSGGFGTFTMGDTDGALDWAMTELDWGGTINDLQTVHTGFNANDGLDGIYDGQILRWDYNFQNFAVGLSMEIDDDSGYEQPIETSTETFTVTVPAEGTTAGTSLPVVQTTVTTTSPNPADQYNDIAWGIGARGTWELQNSTIGGGVGYQGANDANVWGISADWSIAGFTFGANYMDATKTPLGDIEDSLARATGGSGFSPAADESGAVFDYDYWGIGASYVWDAWLFAANYGQYSFNDSRSGKGIDGGQRKADFDGFAIWANYELGDGITAQAGYSYNNVDPKNWAGADGERLQSSSGGRYSLGLAMTF